MRTILKICLPYTLLATIGVAIWVSNYRPNAGAVPALGRETPASIVICSDCGSEIGRRRAIVQQDGDQTHYYCCGRCLERNTSVSGRQTASGHQATVDVRLPLDVHVDPVCNMEVTAAWGFEVAHEGREYFFCTKACRNLFAQSPDDFLGDRCIVCNGLNNPAKVVTATYMGKSFRLCSQEHRGEFKADPAGFFMHTMWGIPSWMYYASIAAVLVI